MGKWACMIFLSMMILAGCQPAQPIQDEQVTPAAQVLTPAVETPATGAIETPAATPVNGPQPLPAFDFPAVLVISENQLFHLSGVQASEQTADLEGEGIALAAVQTGEVVLSLGEQGVQRIQLPGGPASSLVMFEQQALFGSFLAGQSGGPVVSFAVVDDPQAEFGMGTCIGIFEAGTGNLISQLSFDRNVQPIALSQDGKSLFLLPRGQDPDFISVQIASLPGGELTHELSIMGAGLLTVSPNQQTIVTHAIHFEENEGYLRIYDLGDLAGVQEPAPRTVSLPDPPSLPGVWAWSPDGKFLYFALLPGLQPGEEGPSLGLWRLEISGGEITRVMVPTGTGPALAVTSPNGHWLLSMPAEQDQATLLDTATGSTQTVILTQEAIPQTAEVGFEAEAWLSNDGQWLLRRTLGDEHAFIIHLASGTTARFDIPLDALFVEER